MNTKPFILCVILIPSLCLFAFASTSTSGHNRSALQNFLFSPTMKTDTGGRAVNLDSAQACINRYTILMGKHGFADQAGLPINIHLTKTSQITTGETFIGQNFLDWLNGTATQYSAAGKTLMIKIQLGVYDMNYLNTYQSDPALRTANNNRIAIFIIPYDASTGKAAIGLAQPTGGTGGGSGYDLGGVQP